MSGLQGFQRAGLVLLRTLVGWHFLYEGYYKLVLPGWSRAGRPLAAWSASAYLDAASGPLAGTFHALAHSRVLPWIDVLVPLGLLLVGLSLLLGLLTQVGGWAAVVLLSLFYLAAMPTSGLPQPGGEGAYLLVNKNLIELAAVLVVLSFRTGRIAGLDLLLPPRRRDTASADRVGGPAESPAAA